MPLLYSIVPMAPSQTKTRVCSSDRKSFISEESNMPLFGGSVAIIFSMKEIVIVAAKRTPMGEYGGALRDFTALELGAFAAKAAIEQSEFAPGDFDHSIFG